MYDQFLDLTIVSDTQQKACCPFHKDSNPSLFINTETDQWFCFACNEGGGIVKFIQKLYDVSEKIAQYAADFYKQQKTLPFPSIEEIDLYHAELYQQPAVLSYLSAIGVSQDIIKEYKLGWDSKTNRVIIPIRSRTGYHVNLRKYMPPGSKRTATTPKTIQLKHMGENRYFPYEAFDKDEIFVVEGEKDCLVARSQGINAVSSTGGQNIPLNEIQLFKDKKVYLMLDSDKVGKRLTKSYFTTLKSLAKEVKIIMLPTKDFSDFWEVYKSTDILKYDVTDRGDEIDRARTKLKDSIGASMVDSEILLESMKITGKHVNSYTIPKTITINCSGSSCKKECPFKDGEFKIEVEERDILSFMKSPDSAQENFLKGEIGCGKATITNREYVNAQVIFFQEDITSMTMEEIFNQMQTGIYLFDKEPLQSNKTYDFKAIRTTDPRTQQIVFIITDATEKSMDLEIQESDLAYFSENAEKFKDLDKLVDFYYDKWLPHLEVFGRKDLFLAALLTYLSAIGFYWGNTLIKGWLDCLIIGDTRTGKSKLIKNFMKTVGLGAYVSGENSKKTGIIGGVQKLGDNWSLSWGIVPLNDKRLTVIDEASGLAVEDIQELSQMRSEGILSITKIVAETTTARTRLLWVSNPRSGQQLGSFYWKGMDALREFLPVQEDLARFDVVVSAGLNDVSNIHQIVETPLMEDGELNLWRQLILFAWNLKPEQIYISNDMKKYIIKRSEELGELYTDVPLFLKTNGYEKLARLSIALAVLTYSYDNGVLTIKEEHVDNAVAFLRGCYRKQSFSFEQYSKKALELQEITDEKTETIKNLFTLYPNLGLLFECGYIKNFMVQEVLGIDKDSGNKLISQLSHFGFIKPDGGGYKTMPGFLDIIRSINN